MSTPRTDIDEWVLASAAEVARNVARHGVPITWSEAAERLRRTVELLSGQVFVIDDGGTFTPLPQQETPRWQETGFAESVACAAVHYAGQPYYPENPQSSRVELAVPWDTATALVHLLSALVVARLTGPTPSCNQEQVEAARLLNRLSADVAFEFSRDLTWRLALPWTAPPGRHTASVVEPSSRSLHRLAGTRLLRRSAAFLGSPV
ncbi:MAG: hypothetical protein U1C73_22600, partial [Dietzia sp.]|nr:hypothetical protein [Dietzia sp.]